MPSAEDMKLSVVIPVYNEEKNVPDTVAGLQHALKAAAIPYELILVNDNSTDGSAAVLADLAAGDPCIRVVTRRPPRGFGRAVRSGLQAVRGDVVVLCMADQSDSPGDVVAYYRKIQEGYDCVFGSRFMKGSRCTNYPRLKLVINRLVNRMLQVVFWTGCNDLTNSFKAYRTSVIRGLGPLVACHFNITIELSLGALIRGYSIARMPISWQGRTWGSSNLHLSEMGRRYLSTLLKIWFEKRLILDDIIAESVHNRREGPQAAGDGLDRRLAAIEDRLEKLEGPQGR